jgi:hypothetical protein
MEDFKALISELNDELYERAGDTHRRFSHTTDGYTDAIHFGEILIWYSENDGWGEWDDEKKEYAPFGPYIRGLFNREVTELQQARFLGLGLAYTPEEHRAGCVDAFYHGADMQFAGTANMEEFKKWFDEQEATRGR